MAASNKSLLILLCALFALVVIVSAEVVSTVTSGDDVKEVDQYGRGRGGYGNNPGGGGYGNNPGGGGGGYGNNPGGGGGGYGNNPGRGGGGYGRGGGGGGRCRYGCCRGYRYSYGCGRCCVQANEAPDAFFADDVKN